MKEVVELDHFGICPRCGKLMAMLRSSYVMYGLTYSGKYPNRIFEESDDITYACLCGAKYEMVMTPNGIYPKDYRGLDKLKLKQHDLSTVIGYVDDKKETKENE